MSSKEIKNLRVFGFGLTLILALFGLKHSRTASQFTFVFLAGSVFLGCVTALAPQRLAEFYRGWMKVARVIGVVFSTVLLTIIFYLMFGITGIILRLSGKDVLEEKIDPKRESYWVPVPPKPFQPEDYKRQF